MIHAVISIHEDWDVITDMRDFTTNDFVYSDLKTYYGYQGPDTIGGELKKYFMKQSEAIMDLLQETYEVARSNEFMCKINDDSPYGKGLSGLSERWKTKTLGYLNKVMSSNKEDIIIWSESDLDDIFSGKYNLKPIVYIELMNVIKSLGIRYTVK